MANFVPFPPVCESKYNHGDHVLVWRPGDAWPSIAIIDVVYRIQRNRDKPLCRYDAHNAVDTFEQLPEIYIYPDTLESKQELYKAIIRDKKLRIECYKRSIDAANEHITRVRKALHKLTKEN